MDRFLDNFLGIFFDRFIDKHIDIFIDRFFDRFIDIFIDKTNGDLSYSFLDLFIERFIDIVKPIKRFIDRLLSFYYDLQKVVQIKPLPKNFLI